MPIFTSESMMRAAFGVFLTATTISGHGYIQSPRSRNYVAYDDGVYWPLVAENPKKEDCPHCLNRGGTLARCGMVAGSNYDTPLNGIGGPMGANPQASYQEGQEIIIDVVLSAHHMGHFDYWACPISEGQVADQACFDANPLEFIEDMLYGAPKDPNYPERAYIAPTSIPNKVTDNSGVSGMKFSHKFRLPAGVAGDLVLIQWHYWTANSCVYEGYSSYSFPDPSWVNSNLGVCANIPEDGNGVPEQFWNCAEVSIAPSGPTTPPAPTPPPVVSPTLAPVVSPTPPPMVPPSPSPVVTPTPPPAPTGAPEMCCPAGYSGLRAYDSCTKFHHCVSGEVVGSPIPCPSGLLFDQSIQNCNWADQVTCSIGSC